MTAGSLGQGGASGAPARLLGRLRSRDTTLWSDDPEVGRAIENRLGWLDSVDFSRSQLGRIEGFADRVRDDGFDHVVLLGMGGSSLAPEVFNRCFADAEDRLAMTVLDTTFPDSVVRTADEVAHRRPLFIVSSKSGSTAETDALFRYYREWSRARFGDRWGGHFVAITDAGSSLHEQANAGEFREAFLNPADIGGRYSALSLFGLVPARLAGVDVATLLDRAEEMLDEDELAVAAVELGMHIGQCARAGRDKLALTFSPRLQTLGLWIEQLVAESTGKQGVGVVPFFRKSSEPGPAFEDESLLVSSRLEGDHDTLTDNMKRGPEGGKRATVSIALDEPHALGAEFMRWQLATAAAAAVMAINPFDEPDVNSTKRATNLILKERYRSAPLAVRVPAFDPAALSAFLGRVARGDYLAILAYLPSDQGWDDTLDPLRELLQLRTGAVTCQALGPRYLHASGQLHKGGKKNGHFLLLTAAPGSSAEVPGERYDFGTLIDAQARADVEVLRERGQDVLHFDLGPIDGAEAKLREITDCIRQNR